MLAHESDEGPIRAPDDVFDRWAIDLGDNFLLLDVVQNDRAERAEDEACRATVENLVRGHRRLD